MFNLGIYTSSKVTTTNFCCLNDYNFLKFYITNFNSGSDLNASRRLLLFKIPLNATNGQVLYLG